MKGFKVKQAKIRGEQDLKTDKICKFTAFLD